MKWLFLESLTSKLPSNWGLPLRAQLRDEVHLAVKRGLGLRVEALGGQCENFWQSQGSGTSSLGETCSHPFELDT